MMARPSDASDRIDGTCRRAIDVVVDGTDGAGKTPCVAHVVEQLRLRGRRVASHAPYREVEVYPLWASDPERAARTIVGVMHRFRTAHPEAELFVWDRGWPTAFISTDDARARARFEPLPAVTVLLLHTVERTRALARAHPDAGVWATDDALVRRYHDAYHGLAHGQPSAPSLSEPSEPTVMRFFPDPTSMYDLHTIGDAVERALDEIDRRRPSATP